MSERLEDLRDQSKTNELLKKYCDVQSTRIDLLEKRLDRLEKLAIVNNKIQKRYQMTEGQEAEKDVARIKEIPEDWKKYSKLIS